jgi:hypothetical protein
VYDLAPLLDWAQRDERELADPSGDPGDSGTNPGDSGTNPGGDSG